MKPLIAILVLGIASAFASLAASTAPSVPLLATTNAVKLTYVAVKASNNAGDSPWSNEVTVTNVSTARLGWNASTGNPTNYTLGYGTNSGSYSNFTLVGTNLAGSLVTQKTNRVVKVGVIQGASPSGPWSVAPWAGFLLVTNPNGSAFFKVSISETNF